LGVLSSCYTPIGEYRQVAWVPFITGDRNIQRSPSQRVLVVAVVFVGHELSATEDSITRLEPTGTIQSPWYSKAK